MSQLDFPFGARSSHLDGNDRHVILSALRRAASIAESRKNHIEAYVLERFADKLEGAL